MSFKYKRNIVTLENYRQIFKACSIDILDEIRSAILDDTPISKYIEPCGNDSYKLGQIRMALRDMIPQEYINSSITGRTIYLIRQGFYKGRDMSSILPYVDTKILKVPANIIEQLAEIVYLGTDISKVNFETLPTKLVSIFCKGLNLGYPMWLLQSDDAVLDEKTVSILMRGLQLGVDVSVFLNGKWSNDCIITIFSYAKSVKMSDILPYINHKFDADTVRELLDLVQKGIPISKLCVKDTDGYPVYNRYQIHELGSAIEDGCITEEMYRVTNSDMDIAMMHQDVLASRNRKLSTSLGKNK